MGTNTETIRYWNKFFFQIDWIIAVFWVNFKKKFIIYSSSTFIRSDSYCDNAFIGNRKSGRIYKVFISYITFKITSINSE